MNKSKALLLFILPGLLIYLVFFVLPTLSSLFFSFTDWSGMSGDYRFVGMANYQHMLNDTVFQMSLGNNLKFMFVVLIVQFACSLALALFLKKNTRTNVFLRAVYFFPTILSSVSVSFIWLFMYDPNFGVLNAMLDRFNVDGVNWLGDKKLAIYSVAFVQAWFHTGQMIVIFVAGLQSIPDDLYEVARIEGASEWQIFRNITWPLVAPAAVIVAAYTTIQSFKAFDLIFAMTRGGPNYSTEILSTYLYSSAFMNNQFGYASAISMVFMLIVALITLAQFKLLQLNRVDY
ncbi:carbohydrate ABC transporter permease [Bacillus sp. V5-8f]|uniref:carbohydrate ABC transporter permease n=1 Tax=Bacillus sp. V5-8f TaxID=2053044 RepID=UPI0015E15525|nr:sugar ABC transporter permease [Bacillus sp. V5-8f]